jgi:hypothetical protein
MLVVPKLLSLMVKEGTVHNPAFSNDLVEQFAWIFGRCTNHMNEKTSEKCMDVSDVKKWLIAINGIVGRGSEFREEARQMRWKDSDANDEGEKKFIFRERNVGSEWLFNCLQ